MDCVSHHEHGSIGYCNLWFLLGLKNLSDRSLFIYLKDNIWAYFLVYVEDIILVSSSKQFTNNFFEEICGEFAIKDLGTLKYFLGINLNKLSDRSLMLTHHQYLENILLTTESR
ncbi:DNA-directed DNA polymerase [Zostera marina]|uniref:DNA-directed DNA polymerase n=1 Tax=Zostera marina TaxID=29655 RepID=A0A0K9Q3L2_ZOSMR|nr:DNA-directed DNA polymerase [Zostera marina]